MKNKFMRAAVILLALVLMTSCFVGGTFAKYVTQGEGSDTARVAAFGVEVEVTGTLFKQNYGPAVNSIEYTVASSDNDKVVAPGTDGELTSIAVTGTPEVAVEITVTADDVSLSGWMIDDDDDASTEDIFYCPLTVTVGDDDLCGLDYTSASAFADAIKEKIEGFSAVYAPNTNLSTGDDAFGTKSISWAWEFEGSANGQTDALDTKLGDSAAAGTDNTITLGVTVLVEQID